MKKDKINKVIDYIKNVLEVPRTEYNGMSACPFAKKERENDNLYICGSNFSQRQANSKK